MRERDRELKRRRHRRTQRLKKRHNEEALHRSAERPTASKRTVKKAPPAPAEANSAPQGNAATAAPTEEPAPKKKPAAKKAPARKAPAPAPEPEGGSAEDSPGPEEPQGS